MRLHNSQDQHEESSTRQGLHTPIRTLPVSLIAVAIAALLAMILASCGDPAPEPTPMPQSTPSTAGGVSLTPVPPTATPTISDREALVALYNATDGPNWRDSTNWLSDEPLDEWHGVKTDDNGRVIELILWRRGLNGEIPPELGRLSNLQNLYLRSNDLSGTIPPELANLSKLEVLDLAWNKLTGSFPPDLVKLQSLTYLDIGETSLTGCLPDVWKGRFRLRYVDYDVFLEGSDLGGLPFCFETSDSEPPGARNALIAFYNATDGPNWKNNLNWLTDHPISIWHGVKVDERGRVIELRLPDNDLSGEITLKLSNLTDLQVLDLHRNDLIGERFRRSWAGSGV